MFENQKDWTIKNFLEVRDGGLSICGVSAAELAEKFQTPLFVFSEHKPADIQLNIQQVKNQQ